MSRKKPLTVRQVALKHGFRSGLEDKIADSLTSLGIPFEYEKLVIGYTQPAKARKYTPDFVLLNNNIIIESKGRFITADRQKHLMIKEQYPDLDIRFVFSNSKAKLSKLSQTTYGIWCRSEEHTSELQSLRHLVCRLLLEKKNETEPYMMP